MGTQNVYKGGSRLVNAKGKSEAERQSEFKIDVVFVGDGLSSRQQAAFSAAADRWSEIIVGDLPSMTVFVPQKGLVEVDDVRIEARGEPIDGRGRILGQAGPRRVRPGSSIPYTGIMSFDSADLAGMEADNSLENVIIHEMGHVLGLGTIWSRLDLLRGAGTINPTFIGTNAMREYQTLAGRSEPTPVPVANTGGPGTRDGHWRELVLGNELMTGFLSAGHNPISRLTIAAFEDLGYTVNYDAAEPYILPDARALAEMGLSAVHADHGGHGDMFFPDIDELPSDTLP